MPKECVFCPGIANSPEHIWSKWMRALFKSKRFRFIQRDSAGKILKQWVTPGIDQKAKVVCKPCNEGWMSDLENNHAKPAMADLIVGKDIFISASRAKAIARFAFKTAVIIDHMSARSPFFSVSSRKEFAKSLTIPRNVSIWIAGLFPMSSGRVNILYHDVPLKPPCSLELSVCTFAAGHLIFQVVGAHYIEVPSFRPILGFEHLAVPIWPPTEGGDISWPLPNFVRFGRHFEDFSQRWRTITFLH